MTIQITNISSAINDVPENNSNKAIESGLKTRETAGDEVNISDGASFISDLKISIDKATSPSKLDNIKAQIASGSYADSSKIAEGLLKNLNITGE